MYIHIINVIDFNPRESSRSNEQPQGTHHWLLPKQHIRALLIGPSGCGKTNMLLNIVLRWIKWERLFVIGPSSSSLYTTTLETSVPPWQKQ